MKRLILLLFAFASSFAYAQTIVPIQQIQGWAGQFQPDSCNDGPNPVYLNQTVTVKGVVITNGGLNETTGQTRWIWIRDVTASPSTPFGNISVRASAATTPSDINSLRSGDTILVTGQVQEFNGTGGADLNGETQIVPAAGGVQLLSEVSGPAPAAHPVSVGQLNGGLNPTNENQPLNNITTGEPLEGNFVEISDVTVVRVQITGDRCRILVRDANNNHIWIYDRFRTQRITNGFVPPNVNDTYTKVRGIIEGWKTVCPGTGQNNRGYNINPFSLEHYVKGASSPAIGNFKKSVSCPGPGAGVTISADITDDGSVTGADLLFTTTDNFNSPTVLAMTAVGTRYSATIPPQAAGAMVRYYIRARDNLNNTSAQPNVPALANPFFYYVNPEGCTIRDIQFTPFTSGRSGYVGDSVTVRGIVTASANPTNLGIVFLQQSGQNLWGGIGLTGGALIGGFNVGDLVEVSGVVEESFGLTRIANVYQASVVSSNNPVPTPIAVNPADFSTYNFATCEPYESMLVRLQNPNAGQGLFVVDTNADASRNQNNGEYRIGADVNDPNTGMRILAGRQSGSTFSSLNVSYVNSPIWATVDGIMNVPALPVLPGNPVTLAQGILTFSFANMKLLPRNNQDMDITVALRELTSRAQFDVMPNPASDRISIRLHDGERTSRFDLINAQGQRVLSGNLEVTQPSLSLKGLPAGVYQIRVQTPDGQTLGQKSLSVIR